MKPLLVYDTETTGLPLFKEPSDDPRQPHLVQLAAVLVNPETRDLLETLDVIVRPDGWEIPEDIAAIHGITTERALAEGIDEREAVSRLVAMWDYGNPRVGHNEMFDARIVRIAIKRFGFGDEIADHWKVAPAECTSRLATPIVNLPPTDKMKAAGRFYAKTPKLSEAYEFFMGKPMQGAHNAIADVMACLEVYWAIKDGRRGI